MDWCTIAAFLAIMLINPMQRILILALLAATLVGCGGGKDLELLTSNEDARQLYEQASSALKGARFDVAVQYFQSLEARYPFSPYALQGQLDMAYAYFRNNRPEEAISEADRFIRFNPTHPNVDYAYYIKGLANFSHRKGFLHGWFPRDPANFDQKALHDAFNDFSQLVRRFPDSQYAPDAHQRMIFIRNLLARHEIHVANHYLQRKAWVAAANRANDVLENFGNTPANEDALVVLVKSYRELGLTASYQKVLDTLRLNYPNNEYLAKVASQKS